MCGTVVGSVEELFVIYHLGRVREPQQEGKEGDPGGFRQANGLSSIRVARGWWQSLFPSAVFFMGSCSSLREFVQGTPVVCVRNTSSLGNTGGVVWERKGLAVLWCGVCAKEGGSSV